MKKILRIVQYIYCVYALLCFIILMFGVCLACLVFMLFGKERGGNLVYEACNIWARLWYGLVGIRHREIYEAPYDRNRQCIFLANHVSYMDIPTAVRCIHQPVRVLGKSDMLKYPIFGLIYRMAVIVVDRKNAETRARSVRALKSALAKGISIFIFPEGTFNETGKPLKDFFDGAFRIAIETRTTIQPLIFADTHDRMHYRSIFELKPGKNRVIFLKEIGVENYSLKDIPQLKQKVHEAMEECLRRYRLYAYN